MANSQKLQEKKPISVLVPTFLLRGIDPAELNTKYLNGECANIQFPSQKLEVSLNIHKIEPIVKVGTDPYTNQVYCFQDKSDIKIDVYTTNHEVFDLVRKSGTSSNKVFRCHYCTLKSTDEPLGIPVQMDRNRITNIVTYHVVGNYCSWECMYKVLKINYSGSITSRDPTYIDSEKLLRKMFSDMCPGGILKEAKDKELLKKFGGPLTPEQFKENNIEYHKKIRPIIQPAKLCFEQHKIT